MAHEALVSLNTVLRIIDNFPHPYTSCLVRHEVWSLKSILELNHSEESEIINALKGEIQETLPKLIDLLEYHIKEFRIRFPGFQTFHEALEKCPELSNLRYNIEVGEEIMPFLETMKKINKEYNAKLDMETSNKESPLADEDIDVNVKDMVGVYDEELQQLIHDLLRGKPSWTKSISLVGMAGVGKTTIVKLLYNDPVISDHFDCRAFIRVGPDYHVKDILLDLLVCLFPNYNKTLGIKKSECELKEQICKFLKPRRYLIVLDDVWNNGNDIVSYLSGIRVDDNGSRIIITTRSSTTAIFFSRGNVHKIRFRNEKESWNLFCRKVFVEDSCPPVLEKVGKKIVKKCGGLPLGIISIANILSKAEKSLDYWEKVAKNENLLALATEHGSSMSDTLYLSYKHLVPHLKECCLYFGVFPLNHKIPVSKLVKLWVGEGLVEPNNFKTPEDTARDYLGYLIFNNIVLVHQGSSTCGPSKRGPKTCNIHYFFWHLLVKEAANKKKFHLINNYPSAFSEDIYCQRRLCIHRNALLGFKRVSELIESISNVRSFLCTGPEHQYPVSICSGLTSIKVLDALTIRLYKFQIGILELVELKYLAFKYDGKLPSSISRLKNLVYLIVHRYHLKVINSPPSYMPIEIWNMQELRHLQVMGSDLPHPVDGAHLTNLLTLLGVSDRSCTKEVLQNIPNLEKLGVRILLQLGVSETLHIFDQLALLSRLKSFKCIVSNPGPRSQQVLLFPPSAFPSSLTKLTLSGCGLAWKHMSIIGALKNLLVLKLRCYAFQGPEWVVDKDEFPKLNYLLLEDTDLVHWRVGYDCFPLLERLIIRHCYKLEEIPFVIEKLKLLGLIELVDCNPSVMASAEYIQRKCVIDELKIHIRVRSSLEVKKVTNEMEDNGV